MTTSRSAALSLAVLAMLLVPAARGQTVATGAGREDELSQAARIDGYLAEAAAAPNDAGGPQLTQAEAAASANALPRPGALAPLAPDSPWARGVSGPVAAASTPARTGEAGAACDHKVHGQLGAEIGTRGERGGYGVATLPLDRGCQAWATVGVGTERDPRWRGRSGELTDVDARIDTPHFSLGVSGVSDRGGPVF